jgi:CRP/FNR family transcriptional regulator, cyclic AMP receptor protein
VSPLSPTEWDLFVPYGTTVALAKGGNLMPSEEPSPCVYIIRQGFCKLMMLNDEGKRFSISILKDGHFWGAILPDDGLLSERLPNTEPEIFLEAFSPCLLLRVDHARFIQVLAEHPDLYRPVMHYLHTKNKLLQRTLANLLFKDVHARIAQLLLDLLFDHGETCPYAFGLKRDLQLRHHDIAELIGASRPVTSLALGDFLKADLIHKHDGFICLQEVTAIQQVAQGGFKQLNMLLGN